MIPIVVCAGGLGRDCIVPAEGPPRLMCLGGNAPWSAMGAAAAGARPRLLASMPSSWAVEMLAQFDAAGLDRTGVLGVAADAPLPEWFFHAADGSRVDGVFGWPPPSGPRETWLAALRARTNGWTINDFRRRHGPPPWPPEWHDVAGLHLAPHAAAQQVALTRQARAAGVRIVTCDPQARVDDQDTLLAAVDAFLPSERELHAWVPDATPAEALAQLAARCQAQLAVKLGARGVLWWDRAAGAARHLPAIRVDAPDPTGAGDAFCGGVLAGLVQGEHFPRALWRGTVAASFAVQHAGADAALAAASPQGFRTRLQQEPLAA